MVRGRERSAESSTRLAISHVTVGKEHAGLSSETVGNLAGLTHITVLHLYGVRNRTAVRDDGVLADDTRTDIYGGIFLREDGTIGETCGTIDFTIVLHDSIGNLLRIDDFHTIAQCTALRLREANLLVDESDDAVLQLFVAEVLHHESCQLRVQVVEQHHIAVTHLVQHTDHVTLTKGSTLGGLHRRHVRDVTVAANGIVVDEIANFLYQAVVAHGDIT